MRASPPLFFLGILSIFFFPWQLHASDSSTAELIKYGHYKQAQVILEGRLKANPNDA